MNTKTPTPTPPQTPPERDAVRRWQTAVHKAEADLHRAIKRRHGEDYFQVIRAKVDKLEEADKLRLPSLSRADIDVPFWDRMLITWEQYGEPLALFAFAVIFIIGVLIGAVI